MEAVSTWMLATGLALTILLATLARYQVKGTWQAFVIMVLVDMLLFVVYRLANDKEG